MFISIRNFFLDKDALMGSFGGYLKFLTVISTVFGGILYYVPISRSYFRRGCHILIDFVAFSLKSVLNSFDAESESVNQARVTFPNDVSYREFPRGTKQERRQRREEIRMRRRGQDVKKGNQQLSTVQLYPGGGLQLQKYLRESHSQFGESEIYMLKEPRNPAAINSKWSSSTIRRRDDDPLYSEIDDVRTLNSTPDEINQLKKRTSRRSPRDETEVQKFVQKLRKLRRRIRSIVTVPDENFKLQKETEALAIIEELLTSSNYKIDSQQVKKNIMGNRPEGDKTVGDVNHEGAIPSERKSRGSSRQGSPRAMDLPTVEIEKLCDDLAAPPALLNDRVTPMLRNTLHWIFGACPGSHGK